MLLEEPIWDEIIKKYENGYTSNALAREYKISIATIRRNLIKRGIEIRSSGVKFTGEQVLGICSDYENGIPITELSKKHNTTPETIKNFIDKIIGIDNKYEEELINSNILKFPNSDDININNLMIYLDKVINIHWSLAKDCIMMSIKKIIKDNINGKGITISVPDIKILEEDKEKLRKMTLTNSGKLTKEQVASIIEEKKNGSTFKALAKKYGVAIPTIKYHVKKSLSQEQKQEQIELSTEMKEVVDNVEKEENPQ